MKNQKQTIERQVFYLILSYAVWGVFWGGWGVLLPAVKSATGATDGMLGAALIGISIGALPAMLGTGLLVKRFTKWVLLFGLLFFAVSIAAITIVKTPITLAIVLFFVGSSSGVLDVIMNAGVATLESLTGKRYFNYAHAAFPIAVIITSPTIGVVRQLGVNVNVILLTMSGIILLVGLISLRLKMNYETQTNLENEKKEHSSRKLLFTKAIIVFGFIGLLVHLMENAVEQWSAIYLEQNLLSTPTVASLGLTGYMAMLFLGRIIAQKINAYWSDKKILEVFSIISVVGFILAAVSMNPIFVIMGFTIAGLGIAPIVPIIFSLTGRSTSEDKKVRAISSVTVIAYTGYLVSPPLVGFISTVFNLRTAWFTLTVVGVMLVISIVMLPNDLYIQSGEGEKIIG